MASKRDFYEILGVGKTATAADIKRAYRKLVHQYHPDRNKSIDASAKFKEIQEAYEVLSHEDKRKAYDQFGHAGLNEGLGGMGGFGQGGPDFSGFTQGFGGAGNFEDLFQGGGMNGIFEEFFGNSFVGQGRRSRGPARGEDLKMNLNIELEDAAFGIDHEISYNHRVKCEVCNGTGSKNKELKECPTCKGKGKVVSVQRTILGSISMKSVCPECEGEGQVPKEKCTKCDGRGTQEQTEKLTVKIPKGAEDGLELRFTGKGNAGSKGGEHGDLYVEINVKDHKLFTREGNDILLQYRVPLKAVVLGDEINVPTLHGDEKLKIPAGTQFGEVLEMKGKGVPKRGGSGNGDQLVKIVFDVPKKLSAKEKELWETLS